MQKIKIGNKIISRDSEPFIISEAGINHNGELEKAFKMIEVSKKANVDAIKFQTFKAEEFIIDSSLTYTYKSNGKEVTESMLDMFKRYEFSPKDWKAIKKKCVEENILFLSTPQNYSDLELLLDLGIEAIKVGSDDFINIPLLKSYAKTGLPLILSFGMANLAEIFNSLDAIGTFDGYPTILLLCTSQYPTPPEDVNLKKLKTLKNLLSSIPLGFSDHTKGVLASSLAVAFGAVVFEKHFTLDNNLAGPDHWFSENPKGLASWVNSIYTSYKMLGTSLIKPTNEEEKMKILSRRSIVALKDIKKGEKFTYSNIVMRRPGGGLEPQLYEKIIYMVATRNIKKSSLLKLGDFE